VRDHDLESSNHLRKRNRSVILPSLQVLYRVDEDDEVLLLALEEHLGSINVSARHVGIVVNWKGFEVACKGLIEACLITR